MTATFKAIWAENTKGIIGGNNTLLWHIPEDLLYFKDLTQNGVVLMGRKTWESLPEKSRPLPNRKNYVLTTNPDYEAEGATVINDLKDLTKNEKEVWVIGGGEIYEALLPYCSEIHVTEVQVEVDEETENIAFAPSNLEDFYLISRTQWLYSKTRNTMFRHLVYRRK